MNLERNCHGTALRTVWLQLCAWVWVALAVCEALVMEEESEQGSKCFFDSVAIKNSGVER